MLVFSYSQPFITESGEAIHGLEVAYHTYGKPDKTGNNVIWICHAFSADSDAAHWWPTMVGEGKCFDTDKYYIVCANILGSCYGTTGPLSVNPLTGRQWLHDFPEITIRDIVQVNDLLKEHLGIKHIQLVIGGSIGGFQCMEWALIRPELFSNIALIACSAKASPWVIAFNESQRLALLADTSFSNGLKQKGKSSNLSKGDDGLSGLKAARSIAMLSYRTAHAYGLTQQEDDNSKVADFRAASYQQYQGEKFIKRFNAYSYYVITRFIDSHNIFRSRLNMQQLLSNITARTMVIGITTDGLYPVWEQKQLAALFPDAQYREITSDYGHDGFLIESCQLTQILSEATGS